MALGIERTQVAKYESSSEGGSDTDRGIMGNPTKIRPQEDAIESAGIYFQDATARDENVYLARDNGEVVARDTVATSPSILLGVSKHKSLPSLLHALVQDNVTKITYSGNDVSEVNVYTDEEETELLRKIEISYSGNDVSSIVVTQYSSVGWERMTGTITYSGNDVSNVSWVYGVSP